MRRAAALKVWGLPVIWEAGEEPPVMLTATAETVPHVTVVHVYHWHVPAHSQPEIAALPPGDADNARRFGAGSP